MSNTSEKLEKIEEAAESGENISQILSNIKDIINNPYASNNVLILTERIEEGLKVTAANDRGEDRRNKIINDRSNSTQARRLPDVPDILDQPVTDINKAKGRVAQTSAATQPLVRADVATAATSAIAQMLNIIASDMQKNSENHSVSESTTLEDVVILLLKSELQKWLNNNLENMVKSIVEDEIKRIMPK